MIFSVLAFAGLVNGFNCNGHGEIASCECKDGTDCTDSGPGSCNANQDGNKPVMMTCTNPAGYKVYRHKVAEPCKNKGGPNICTCDDGTVLSGSGDTDCANNMDSSYLANYPTMGCQDDGGCSIPKTCTCKQVNKKGNANYSWKYGCGKYKTNDGEPTSEADCDDLWSD